MLRISYIESTSRTTALQLEGRVIGPWVTELRAECERAASRGNAIVLDLEAVTFVDREGVALLRDLAARGAQLSGCSPFVEEELR